MNLDARHLLLSRSGMHIFGHTDSAKKYYVILDILGIRSNVVPRYALKCSRGVVDILKP